jgi:hypothetical protein
MARDWQPVPQTRNWVLVDDETSCILRQVAVRDPYLGESDGTKFVVTGSGHEASTHGSMDAAQAAAEASLS